MVLANYTDPRGTRLDRNGREHTSKSYEATDDDSWRRGACRIRRPFQSETHGEFKLEDWLGGFLWR